MKREVSNPSSPSNNNSPPTFPTLQRTPPATTGSKVNSNQCTGIVAQDIIASDCAASCSKSRTGRGKKVTFLPVTLTTRTEEVQNNQNNSPEFVHDKEPGGDTQAGGSGSSSGCGGSSFQTKAGTGSVYSHYLREQLGTPYPYSNSATCFTEIGVSSSSTSGKLVFPVVNVHSPSGGRTGRCARICGSVSPAGIASSSGSSSGLLTAKSPLTAASVSHRSGYELEISRSIDVSSSSASIFYTVPVVSGRKAAGRRETEDFLGTPSILKPFRDLQEPTRFLTTKNTVGASVSLSNPKTNWKASHRLKQKAVTTGKASISFSASTDQIVPNEDEEKAATQKRRRHLSKSYSDFSLHKQLGRIGAKEDQKMPIRVRMRRDEYFYTETTSKSTQTSDPDVDLEEGEMSGKPEGARIRASESQSVDRSTSPIQDISCSSPLKKLEDLEKVTGHFVIQRFFTRTEQDFTTWLEQQLAVASTSCSKGVQVASVEEEEETVEDVAANEGAQAETEVEALLQRRPSTPQISITEPPEDVMVQEGEEWKESSAENDGNMLAVDGAAVVAILRPLSSSKENVIAGGEDTKGEPETDSNHLNAESQMESNDQGAETVEAEDGEKTNGALVQVEADRELESSNVGSSSVPQEDPPNSCKTTDLIPCECFSEYFLHEENIARLLISLSPKASSTITEAHFLTATVSSQDGMGEFGEEKIAKFEALLLSTKSRVLGSIRKSKSSHSMSQKRKSKSVESFPCEDTRQDQESRTASTDHAECEMYPDFVFPRPRGNRRIRKSTSVDSCLGTEYSSIKTRNDSGTSTLGRYVVDGSYEKFSETFDYLHDSQSQGDDQAKMAEENTGFVTEDSGIKSNPPNSMRSETSLSSPKKGDGEQVTEPIVVAKVICSRKSANEATGRTKAEFRRFKSKSSERRDLVSGESDTESEFIRSENYHARSEAESDTDMTTDGDAIVEDPIAYRRRTEFSEDDQRFDLDMTDVDDDDKDNDLTARLELDDFQLDLDKPLPLGIRNSCTQTNRSLYSPAWSQGSATSQTTNGSESHFDLEVVAKKFPVETTSAGGRKHNYLPSSSSSLNFVNVSMNLNVNSKTEESKFKLSVSLPGGVGRSRLPPAVGGAKTSGGFRVHNYPRQSISEQDSRDLPSLWAHVRNRLDSKVSAADGASGNDTVDGRRDSLVLSGKCSRPLDPMSPREKAMGHTPTQDYKMTQTKKPHQYHLRHNQIMQNKAYKNSDRIKRSLARLSKLLDNDK